MSHDLSPTKVARRLERLRRLYVPMSEEEARHLMTEAGKRDVPFAQAVAQRLAELRALCDLTTYLHSRRSTE